MTPIKRLISTAILLFVFPAVNAETGSPFVWNDHEKNAVLTIAKMPAAHSSQDVREQIAGVLDSWLAQPFLPIEFGKTTIDSLTTFYFRGVLLTEPEGKGVLGFVLFGAEQTFVGAVVTSEVDVDFQYVADHAPISDKANSVAVTALDEIARKAQSGLPEFKRAAVAQNSAAINRMKVEIRKGDSAVETVKTGKGDLSPDHNNAESLDQKLRLEKPERIYGWGSQRLNETEQSVVFLYEANGKPVSLVWIVNTANGTFTNITANAARTEELRVKKLLNHPSDLRLMNYDPRYEMTSFKNSDYYRGRGTDQLGQTLN